MAPPTFTFTITSSGSTILRFKLGPTLISEIYLMRFRPYGQRTWEFLSYPHGCHRQEDATGPLFASRTEKLRPWWLRRGTGIGIRTTMGSDGVRDFKEDCDSKWAHAQYVTCDLRGPPIYTSSSKFSLLSTHGSMVTLASMKLQPIRTTRSRRRRILGSIPYIKS